MAKATAICTCKVCGKKFEKTATKHNRKEADEWEAWAEWSITLCPECWKKEQRKKENAQPLRLVISIDPETVDAPVLLCWGDGTLQRKDEIKALGYKWGPEPTNGFSGLLDFQEPPKCWFKRISIDQLDGEIKKAKDLCEVKIQKEYTSIDLAMLADNKKKKEAAKEAEEKALAELGPAPKRPEWLGEARWNGKIYGTKKCGYRIYQNNEEIKITESQAKELEDYQKESEKWQSAHDKIR